MSMMKRAAFAAASLAAIGALSAAGVALKVAGQTGQPALPDAALSLSTERTTREA